MPDSDSSGKPPGALGTATETSHQSMVATMAEGLVVQAEDGRIVEVNPAAERITGRGASEMLGRALHDPMWEAVRANGSPLPAAEHPCMVTLRTGKPQSDVVVGIRTAPGTRRWLSMNSRPMRGAEDGAPRAVVTTFHDITLRVRNDAINVSRLHLVQFAAAHSLDELLEETLNEAETLTGSLSGFYHFVDDDQDSLTLQNWSTRTKAQFCSAQGKGLHYPVAQAGVWVDCARQRKGVVHNDYATVPHRKGLPEGHAPVVRMLAVPVIRGEKIAAILGVGNKPADYDGNDLETVSLIADLAWEIADRKRTEEAQARLNRELRAISNCNQTLMRAQDEQTLLDDICRIVCDEAGYRMAWVGYTEDDERRSVRPVAWAGIGQEDLASGAITWDDRQSGRDPAADAARTGKLVCIQDLAAPAPSSPWRDEALQRGFRSVVALPLLDGNGRAFGVLCIYSTAAHAYTMTEIRLLEELAGDLAFGVSVLRGRVELNRAEQERLEHLRFLECMDRVSRTIQRTTDLDQMMSDALDAVLAIFGCDRAYLLTPCDPEAPSWSVPMERTRPEYPGAHALGVPVPMDPEAAQVLRIALGTDRPVKFGPGTAYPLPHDVSERFGFKSLMAMALYPKVGKPWQFGIHQCSHARIWTPAEEKLFAEIGRQIGEALTSLLMYRDLCVREREFRALAENSPDVIVRYDGACRRLYVNPEFERVNGLSAREVIGKKPLELATALAPVADTFTERLKAVMETGVTSKIDLAWDTDGKRNCWWVRAVPEYDSRGEVVGALTIWSDITEREVAQATIRQLNAELSATLQAIPDLLLDMDGEGTCLGIWAQNPELLAAQKDFLLGHTVVQVLPPQAARTVMAALAEAGTTNAPSAR